MIKTVLFKHKNGKLGCHSVGINNCIKIVDNILKSIDNYTCYEYKAVYSKGKEYLIENVIIATDIKLA